MSQLDVQDDIWGVILPLGSEGGTSAAVSNLIPPSLLIYMTQMYGAAALLHSALKLNWASQ